MFEIIIMIGLIIFAGFLILCFAGWLISTLVYAVSFVGAFIFYIIKTIKEATNKHKDSKTKG